MKNLIKRNRNILIKATLFLAYTTLIFIISNIKSFSTITTFTFEDKIKHFIEYFGYAFITYALFKDLVKNKPLLKTIIFCLLFAISDELHQGFVGYFDTGIFSGIRDCSFFDWVADSLGVIAGSLTYLKIRPFITVNNFKRI